MGRFSIFVFLAFVSLSLSSRADVGELITVDAIAKFSPRARADVVEAIISNRGLFHDSGIVSAEELAFFFSQIATESGGLRLLEENLNYSEQGLLVTFPKYVSPALARRIARKPVDIANIVYANRLGNGGPESGDGWKYRGSGLMQLTGLDNFKRIGALGGLDIVSNPQLARQPSESLVLALHYWKARCNDGYRPDIIWVRRCVNGGLNGIDHAKVWLGRANRVFTDGDQNLESPEFIAETSDLEREGASGILRQLGYLDLFSLESPDDNFEAALSAFGEDRGEGSDVMNGSELESGSSSGLSEDQLYDLTDPGLFRYN
jgi:predicted chitinase